VCVRDKIERVREQSIMRETEGQGGGLIFNKCLWRAGPGISSEIFLPPY
jgi:hypothetical protein